MDKSRSKLKRIKHLKIRNKIVGNSERPRLAVFKSNQHIYAQIIDDTAGITLLSMSTISKSIKHQLESSSNCIAASIVGKQLANESIAKCLNKVVFDRGGSIYHGRLKALADSARNNGLQF
uniref:Large ribosomal subunit protein uL18c n=1 Tax=Corynoplastis japonica TaxID=700918 RepID=A0A1X9PTZ6_9RHOD|nr:50S ribosomal protein L18 [Corynoplastis japonica]